MADQRSLGELIDMQIRQAGPMTVAAYMQLCLGHPRAGYYSGRDPLGRRGDFVTAPEISQMFGELIGFFLVNLWQQLGEPPSFTLLELGPGRGTLMEDALRVAARAPGFIDAMHLQLFESNPALRAEQENRLGRYSPYWALEIDAVADDPLLVVANEFFDAMPIRQLVRTADGWHERQVGLRDGARAFGLSPIIVPAEIVPEPIRESSEGAVYEIGTIAQGQVRLLSEKIVTQRGAILAIDYGYVGPKTGETLQAVSRHAYADALANPGEADLSAHVDFGALARAARAAGLSTHPVVTQGEFLPRLGIRERARALSDANPAQSASIAAALRRLTDPAEMGDLFKVFCAASSGIQPAGFQ